jgi:hypothetical protein
MPRSKYSPRVHRRASNRLLCACVVPFQSKHLSWAPRHCFSTAKQGSCFSGSQSRGEDTIRVFMHVKAIWAVEQPNWEKRKPTFEATVIL